MKLPQPVVVISPSALVPHDPVVNEALKSSVKDYGLKPNGLTIEMMRENKEFYSKTDLLDRAAIASQVSSSLASDVKKVVKAAKSFETDRNKPKNL